MKENKIEKLILDLSNRWDCSPQEAVDRLNSMNESEINKLINSMTKKFKNGGMIDCLRKGGAYGECKTCAQQKVVKNQNPAGPMTTQLPKYGKIVEQGWNGPRYTFLSNINGGDLSTITPDNIKTYDGMSYAVEEIANPWDMFTNQFNKNAGLPEVARMYRRPKFMTIVQQDDLGKTVPIEYSMNLVNPSFDANKATKELAEKQAAIRSQKKACGGSMGTLPKKKVDRLKK